MFSGSFSASSASLTPADASAPFSSSLAASARALFALGDEYGDEAARELGRILKTLAAAGFAKAQATEYSAFERILGGLCWLLQRLVRREDAPHGRVQWELLFQAHHKMKPRLGLAQEVVKRIEALPYACPLPIQPHQLLLQDFGDIGAVRRLVKWLVELQTEATHLEKITSKRKYLVVLEPNDEPRKQNLKREVAYLQRAYAPRRRWQYTAVADANESEDAMIQRCLLEYGERVAAATVLSNEAESGDGTVPNDEVDADPKKSLMAQLAVASAAAASRRSEQGALVEPRSTSKSAQRPMRSEFEKQYEKILKQAMAEQAALLERQREREAVLLQHVVSVPEPSPTLNESVPKASEAMKAEKTALRECEERLLALKDEKTRVSLEHAALEARESAIMSALDQLHTEATQLDAEEQSVRNGKQDFDTLRELVMANEGLTKRKSEFKAHCKTELEILQTRVAQLRVQAEQDAAKQDEETLRLNEIEQMHSQMASKHKEMKLALGRQTRELQKRMKQIDDVPTRIELVQYEKRLLELYEEVALTLDETRKYYCVYNTLKTTHEFLEKEISLINSIHDNFVVAMGSKAATQAYFSQLGAIVQNVESSVKKQQALRGEHQARVETLDSKYQLLLEKERMYVNAIREFQKECEKNERLSNKLIQYRRAMEQQNQDLVIKAQPVAVGVSMDDVVI